MYKQKDNTDLKPRSAVQKPDILQIRFVDICQIDRYWHFTNCIEKTSASLATYYKVTRIIYLVLERILFCIQSLLLLLLYFLRLLKEL